MPCPSASPKMFFVCPNFWGQTKNWIAFSATQKHFRPAHKTNLLNRNCLLVQHKKGWATDLYNLQYPILTTALSLYRSQNVLCRSKCFEPAQNFWLCTAGTKTNFTECKLSFCLAQIVCDCHNYVNRLFGKKKKNLD